MYGTHAYVWVLKHLRLLHVPSSPPSGCETPVLWGIPRPTLPLPHCALSNVEMSNSLFLPVRTTQEAAGFGRLYSSTSCSCYQLCLGPEDNQVREALLQQTGPMAMFSSLAPPNLPPHTPCSRD